MVDARNQFAIAAQNFAGMVQSDFCPVDQSVCFGQRSNIVCREVVAFQGHNVDATGTGGLAVEQHIRRDVMNHTAHAGDERVCPNGREMMDGAATRDCRVMINVHVPAQEHAVRHDDTVADTAVVRNVRTSHEIGIATY